jgi:DNA-binding response OmpR family regulator
VPEDEVSQKPRCRVLVVEDEAVIAMLVEDMVLDFGSEVVGPAARIEAAFDLARRADLDAAILDINVDGTDTFSVADELRERGVPLIFATGYGASVLPERFHDCPALAKPFSYQVLSEALHDVLAHQPCHTEAA